MRILHTADYRVMQWKNGGGTTTEIAVSPDGAGLGDFDWRISMARVEQDGPFSSFPGIDRTLSIIDGEGIILSVSDRIPFGLTKASEPLAFPADAPTRAALIAGPIIDLNVMTRRGRASHYLERLTVSGDAEIAVKADVMLVFCHKGRVCLGDRDGTTLGPLDTLWAASGDPAIQLSTRAPATVFVIHIHIAGQNG